MFTDPNLPSYLFGNSQFSSSTDFLDTWSRYDLDAYCLAMLFAYREFDDGVLGLAWVAGTGGKVGGICQQRVCYDTSMIVLLCLSFSINYSCRLIMDLEI